MKSKLIEILKTKEEVGTLLDETAILISSLYKNGESSFQNVLKSHIRKTTADIIGDEIIGQDPKEYLSDLAENLQKINSVAITFAYEPSQLSIERFYEIVQASVPKKIVLDILYDPGIVGGMVISYGGRYKDYSFRKIFEDDLESTREEVLKYLSGHK